jgi:hypothetical protein
MCLALRSKGVEIGVEKDMKFVTGLWVLVDRTLGGLGPVPNPRVVRPYGADRTLCGGASGPSQASLVAHSKKARLCNLDRTSAWRRIGLDAGTMRESGHGDVALRHVS